MTKIKAEPYQLVMEIPGIGFKTADRIGRGLGLPLDTPARLEVGVLSTLQKFTRDGHVYAPQGYLIQESAQLLGVADTLMANTLNDLEEQGFIRRETLPDSTEPAVYLRLLHQAETETAEALRTMLNTPETRLLGITFEWDTQLDRPLSPDQQQAVQTALTSKVCVITGKPSTGKTTTLRALIQQLDKSGRRYALASPTGRAAKRLAQVTHHEAQTIHRLLGWLPKTGFGFTEYHQLNVDMVVVDEASMVDIRLMSHLLLALSPATHLLLVGDVDQLPSVGPGNVLGDLITSGQIPVARLTTVFRQAADSHIITNAHRINRGQMPLFPKDGQDFFLFQKSDPKAVAEWVVDIVQNRIPRKFGLDPLRDIQVLTPMRKGEVGVDKLNERLQAALNPPGPDKAEHQFGGCVFRVGDRVMQIRNDYDKEVVNGDVGQVSDIDAKGQSLTVAFEPDGQPVAYAWKDVANDLRHCYAANIHKAQGSEFPAVVVPVVKQHRRMLQRNLLYTAITRARQICVLVGTRQAIWVAVENANAVKRWSGLALRLKG